MQIKSSMAVGASCILLVCGTSLNAQPADSAKQAHVRLETEITSCMVYYSLLKRCAGDNTELANQAQQTMTYLQTRAHEVGDSIGMTTEEIVAQIRSFSSSQQNSIGNACSNFHLLFDRYGVRCKTIVENEAATYREYLEPIRRMDGQK